MIRRTLASGNTAIIDPATGKVTTILRKNKTGTVTEPHPDSPAWTFEGHDGEIHEYSLIVIKGRHLPDNCQCGGSGLFYFGGAVVNGNYTGRTGMCFGCRGKGYQTNADVKRNSHYDNFFRKVHI